MVSILHTAGIEHVTVQIAIAIEICDQRVVIRIGAGQGDILEIPADVTQKGDND